MNNNFINAQMMLTSDMMIVQQHMGDPSTKSVFVGDLTNYAEIVNSYGMIAASILLPDYDTMALEVNGDIADYESRYHAYLDSAPALEMILALIAALMKGISVILFVPPEASGLLYPITLMEHFLYRFGIQIQFNNVAFAYNDAFTKYTVKYMYLYNIITPIEYLYYSGQDWYTPEILRKLSADSCVSLPEKEAYLYFLEMQRDIYVKNNMISPVEMV